MDIHFLDRGGIQRLGPWRGGGLVIGSGGGRTFYVDATSGLDTNSGTSPDSAWQTIGKINSSTFISGDHILFKRGENFALVASLAAPTDGLYFGVYGSGANPILDGQDTVECMTGNGKDNLTLENIEVTQGLNFGFTFDTEIGIRLINCSAHDCGNDQLIFDTCSDCEVTGGSYYAAYTGSGDDRFISAVEVMDNCHDIMIDGVEIYGCSAAAFAAHYGTGVAIHTHLGGIMPYNITVQNCNIHDQGTRCFGIRVHNLNTATMTNRNILIANNTIIDGAYGGIQINSVDTINRVVGVTIRDNTITNNAGNYGLALLNQDDCSAHNNLVTNNNDSQSAQNLAVSNCINTAIYNNTLYQFFNNFWYGLIVEGATTASLKIKNNIIGGATASQMGMSVATLTGTTGLEIDYNLYQYAAGGNRFTWLGTAGTYTAWQTAGNDTHSPARGNPLFVNPATGDFALQVGSPAINAGVDVGLPFSGVGVDCGAYEKA